MYRLVHSMIQRTIQQLKIEHKTAAACTPGSHLDLSIRLSWLLAWSWRLIGHQDDLTRLG